MFLAANILCGRKDPRSLLEVSSWEWQIDSFGIKWGLVLGFGIARAALLPIGVFLLWGLRSKGFSLDPLRFWD